MWSTHARASARSVLGASRFGDDASPVREKVLITGPLRHVVGFPDRQLLRDLRHVDQASDDVDPARPASTGVRAPDRRFPRSPCSAGRGGAQLCSCSLATCAAQFHRRPYMPILLRHAELESHPPGCPTHCFGPCQPGFEPLTNRGVSATGSLSLHRPTLLARPRRLVVPPPPVHRQGCSRPPRQLP